MGHRKTAQRPSLTASTQKVSKCVTCRFRLDFSHRCEEHEQEHQVSHGIWIVLECDGWQKAALTEAVAA